MPDDELARFVDSKVREMRGGEPPLRLEGVQPGDVGWTPSSPTPAEYAAWRTAPPPPEAVEEADAAAEEPNEGRFDESELGRFLAENAERAGWAPRPPAEKLDLEAEVEPGAAEEPFAESPEGFIEGAWEAEAQIQADWGMTVPEYLVRWAGASAEEWQATGLPMAAQPSRRDLGRSSQAALDAANFERDLERLREQGRKIIGG